MNETFILNNDCIFCYDDNIYESYSSYILFKIVSKCLMLIYAYLMINNNIIIN